MLVLTIARLLVVLTSASALAVVVGYAIGPERFWLLALIEYLPSPLFLAPALLALLLSLGLPLAWRLITVTTVGLVVWAVMGLKIHLPIHVSGQGLVRVMTYNIKSHIAAAKTGGFLRLKREIDAASPDILMLEDAGESSRFPGSVAALLGSRTRYSFGQFVIASRYPLSDCEQGAQAKGGFGRDFVRCMVDIGGTQLDVYAVHLQTPRKGLLATRQEALAGVADWDENIGDRMSQSEDLAAVLRSRSRAAIVGGDLNAPEVSLVLRNLTAAGLKDAFSSAGMGFGYTYGHALRPGFSFLRIDHVLVSNQIRVATCKAGGAEASEHRPVIADLLIGANRP